MTIGTYDVTLFYPYFNLFGTSAPIGTYANVKQLLSTNMMKIESGCTLIVSTNLTTTF